MIDYKKTLIVTIILAIILVIAVKFIDEGRLNALSKQVSESSLEGESTRLLFLYAQTIQYGDRGELCKVIDFNTKRQMDIGYKLVTLLKVYEEANLLSDYKEVRQRYFLSNVELWIYSTQSKTLCNQSDIIPLIFFYEANSECPKCIAQGNILDGIRDKCKNVRIISLPSDENMDIINLIKSRFNVSAAPTLVVDNKKILNGIQSEENILNNINCTSKSS